MSMEYCHKHDRHYDTDHELECAECIRELDEALDVVELHTVELITHNMVGTNWAIMRDSWAVAQYLGPPDTAIPHWHIWRCYRDYMAAMEDALDSRGRRGGRWAVVVADQEGACAEEVK